MTLDQGRRKCPIRINDLTPFVDGAGPKIIGKHDAVANKNPIFDDDTVGNEDVRLDLASRPYECSTLYLDKRPNSRVVAYRGSIYINELRMIDPDAFTKPCRWMDRQC
jgi:hypothetical protein